MRRVLPGARYDTPALHANLHVRDKYDYYNNRSRVQWLANNYVLLSDNLIETVPLLGRKKPTRVGLVGIASQIFPLLTYVRSQATPRSNLAHFVARTHPPTV